MQVVHVDHSNDLDCPEAIQRLLQLALSGDANHLTIRPLLKAHLPCWLVGSIFSS
jgi:hypothetical protein